MSFFFSDEIRFYIGPTIFFVDQDEAILLLKTCKILTSAPRSDPSHCFPSMIVFHLFLFRTHFDKLYRSPCAYAEALAQAQGLPMAQQYDLAHGL